MTHMSIRLKLKWAWQEISTKMKDYLPKENITKTNERFGTTWG